MPGYKIPPGASIGYVHLTVSDLDKALAFYRDLLGFEVMESFDSAVFLSAGGYHHHIGLNLWSRTEARKPEEGQIGLYHFAILYPNREELGKALKRLLDAN